MSKIECNPECRCCGKTINIDNEESIKVEDGLIHIECEEEYRNTIKKNCLKPVLQYSKDNIFIKHYWKFKI